MRNNTQLQNNVNSTGACFKILENNIDLDCNGFRILFDEAGLGEDGVTVMSQQNMTPNNVTIRNCIIQDINVGGAYGIGINITKNGRIVGDVDFANVSRVVGAITPVPGGVGPMTVVSLFQNLLTAYRLQSQ